MQIKQLHAEVFEQWKEGILALIKETVLANFPDSEIEDTYYQEKCNEVKQYLSEKRALVFIAVADAGLAGWLWCHEIQRFSVRRLHIAFFSVFPAYKKQGVGKKLFHAAEAYAKSCGINGMDLCVTASNSDAVGFYRHMGLKEERFLLAKEFDLEEQL